MKIYFNTYAAAFQCPGGGEIQLLKSKEALERRGHEVILYDQWVHKLNDGDVVHQFSVQGGTYNLCAYCHSNNIPLVLSPILWLSDYIDQYPMGEINFITSVSNVICPNSHAEVERFLNHFEAPKEKYLVTHNGVDACFFDSIEADIFLSEFGIQRPFALCVGNIEVRKNQLALLEACDRIGLQLVLIGNVRDKEYFSEMNSRFSGKFRYLGYLEHDSPILRSAYTACSVFALPSLLETPGLAALEAAAVGAPLVITEEGCTEEYFGANAYYVKPRSVEDIVDKLLMALDSAGKTCELKERVRQFSWNRVALELENAYHKAISSVAHKRGSL